MADQEILETFCVSSVTRPSRIAAEFSQSLSSPGETTCLQLGIQIRVPSSYHDTCRAWAERTPKIKRGVALAKYRKSTITFATLYTLHTSTRELSDNLDNKTNISDPGISLKAKERYSESAFPLDIRNSVYAGLKGRGSYIYIRHNIRSCSLFFVEYHQYGTVYRIQSSQEEQRSVQKGR